MGTLTPNEQGTIDIILDRKTFYPGSTIRGKLLLNLDAPIKARRLMVRLMGSAHTPDGNVLSHISTKMLSKGRTFSNGEQLEFEIKIPENLFSARNGLIEFIRRLYYPRPSEFYLDASLDLPFKMDISEKQKIDIIRTAADNQKMDLSGQNAR